MGNLEKFKFQLLSTTEKHLQAIETEVLRKTNSIKLERLSRDPSSMNLLQKRKRNLKSKKSKPIPDWVHQVPTKALIEGKEFPLTLGGPVKLLKDGRFLLRTRANRRSDRIFVIVDKEGRGTISPAERKEMIMNEVAQHFFRTPKMRIIKPYKPPENFATSCIPNLLSRETRNVPPPPPSPFSQSLLKVDSTARTTSLSTRIEEELRPVQPTQIVESEILIRKKPCPKKKNKTATSS
eukprot:TRINITY_DN1049_c0_g1_i12.p1 TRINITY_DN1049_c0_g1~~TRINITY_DN1049_c0_g1_i12.p1  ORF type:complete len:237 (-),score=20.97 TRINITY_DN1049_c0_g1_i12:8-718(-)